MRVTFAVLADAANTTREGKLNIMGIFDSIQAKEIPVIHPQMQLVIRFEADSAESGKAQNVEVHLMDEDGKKLFVLRGDFTMGPGRPGEAIGSNHILTINMLKFERPGDYEFKILINGALKKEVPLKVLQVTASN
jgi:Family of unknown function (DUF6941)